MAFGNNAYDDLSQVINVTSMSGSGSPAANLLLPGDAYPGAGTSGWLSNGSVSSNATITIANRQWQIRPQTTPGTMLIQSASYAATPGSTYSMIAEIVTPNPGADIAGIWCYFTGSSGIIAGPGVTFNGTTYPNAYGPGSLATTDYLAPPCILGDTETAPAGTTGITIVVAFGPTHTGDVQYVNRFGLYQNTSPWLSAFPNPAPSTTNYWTDITQYVMSIDCSRGRQHELSQFQAGTCTIALDNSSGIFSRWNGSSPLTGLFDIRRPIRYRVQSPDTGAWYNRFTGIVNEIDANWPDPLSQTVTVLAADAFRLFNIANLAVSPFQAAVLSAGATTALYRLSDPGGTTAVGILGTGAAATSGTYSGSPTYGVVGPIITDAGHGVGLKGSSNDQVSFPTTYAVPGGSGYSGNVSGTVEFWVTGSNGVLLHQPGTGNGGTWTLSADNTGVLTVGTTSVPTIATSAAGALPQDGAWHVIDIACAVAGTTGQTLTYTVYVDGVSKLSYSCISGTTATTFLPGSATALILGPTNGSSSSYSVANFAHYASAAGFGSTLVPIAQKCGVQQLSGARINAALDAIGWPTNPRVISTGSATIQASNQSLASTSCLSHIQAVELSEAGALFVAQDGRVTFLAHADLVTASTGGSQATFGDTLNTEIPYQPAPALACDDQLLYNIAQFQRNGGVMQTATSTTSIARYGPQTLSVSGLLLNDDASVVTLAQRAITKYAAPVDRLGALTVQLTELVSTAAAQIDAVFALELMQRVTVNRHALSFSNVSLIEGIAETITVDSWTVTLALSPDDIVTS